MYANVRYSTRSAKLGRNIGSRVSDSSWFPASPRVRLLTFHGERCMHKDPFQRTYNQGLHVGTRQGCEAPRSNATTITTKRAIAYLN
jgi:hypothetical protein